MFPYDPSIREERFCDLCHRLYNSTAGHTCTPITKLEEDRWKLEAWLGHGFNVVEKGD